jgi:hypothetical protein
MMKMYKTFSFQFFVSFQLNRIATDLSFQLNRIILVPQVTKQNRTHVPHLPQKGCTGDEAENFHTDNIGVVGPTDPL